MRILHLASGREWRGGQRQTWLLAKGLAHLGGFSQTVITARETELARRLDRDGVPVRAVSWRMGLDPRAGIAAARVAAEFDVLHAHDGHAVALGALVSRIGGIPLVATRRMTRPLRHPAAWRRAARVIAISDAVRGQLVRQGVAPSRIETIPPAIDLDSLRGVAPFPWAHLGIGPGATVLVAVSALTREKGIDLLVEAAHRCRASRPDLHWVIAGDGPERTGLEQLAGAHQLAPVVHFLGNLADPLPVIAGADALVVPSREEGFGTVILDAMGLGIPVVATAVGGVLDALAGGGGIMVTPESAKALEDAVRQVVGDADYRRKLGEQGLQAVRVFGLPFMVERVAALYGSLSESIEG